jgi:tetratricopeptide (TPR) repeat protein
LAIILGLILACLTVFGAVARHSFINFDDNAYVYENPWVRSGLTRAGLNWAFATIDDFYWQPLTWLSHMLDCQLFGLRAGWHHLINLLLHSLNSVLVFLVFRRMTGAFWRSAALAGLFAVHPLRVESVAWVSERNDLLAGFWFLLLLWVYQWHAERPGLRSYLLVLSLFVLGLMSKPTLVIVPLLLLLLDRWLLRRQALAEKLPMVPLSLASALVTHAGVYRLGLVNVGTSIALPHRIANALVSYASYLELSFWPHDLALPYPYRTVIAWWQVAGAALLLTAFTFGVVWYGRKRPYLIVGWFWFVIGLVPVIGLVQAGAQAMADRFLYLPGLGLGMAVVWAATDLLGKRRAVAAGVYTLLLLGCAVVSRQQVMVWHDSVTLFAHSVKVTRENAVAERQLAAGLEGEGDFSNALPHYSEAVRIAPNYYIAQAGYALALERQGNTAGAVEHFRAALKYFPQFPIVRDHLSQLEHRLSASGANAHE